jgi:hypothetical protein
VSSYIAGIPQHAQMVGDAIPLADSERIALVAAVRSTNANLVPVLGARFLDDVGAVISTVVQGVYIIAADTWRPIGYSFAVPDGAVSFEPVVRATPLSGTPTGSIYADAIDHGSPVLWVYEEGLNALYIDATYTEGYLG